MSKNVSSYEVGKEYKNTGNMLQIIFVTFYVTFAGVLIGSASSGDWSFMAVCWFFLPVGILFQILHAKSGSSHFTVLGHTADSDGNGVLRIKYRHGEDDLRYP